MKTTIKIALAAFAVSLLAGCGGSDTYVRVQGTTTISKGQELTDLQRALKEGAVTKQEYDRLYSKILARPN
jgi:uncharacterized lipoprotein